MTKRRSSTSFKKITAALAVGLAVTGFGAQAWAHGGMAGGGGYPGQYQQGMGPGIGYGGMMGPGMMGPGMMGQGYPYGGMGPGGFGPGVNLTDEQRQQLQTIQQDLYQTQMKRQPELAEAMQNYQNALNRENPDPEAVSKAYDQVNAIQRELLKERIQAQNKMRQILSQAQE